MAFYVSTLGVVKDFLLYTQIDTTLTLEMNYSAIIVIPQLKTNYSTNETFKCAQICEFTSASTIP